MMLHKKAGMKNHVALLALILLVATPPIHCMDDSPLDGEAGEFVDVTGPTKQISFSTERRNSKSTSSSPLPTESSSNLTSIPTSPSTPRRTSSPLPALSAHPDAISSSLSSSAASGAVSSASMSHDVRITIVQEPRESLDITARNRGSGSILTHHDAQAPLKPLEPLEIASRPRPTKKPFFNGARCYSALARLFSCSCCKTCCKQ